MERTNSTRKSITILANDPSICAWGFAVVRNGKVIEVGCIKTESKSKKLRTRKGDDTVRRISEINTVLLDVIRRNGVEYLVSELPHGSQSASAAVMIGISTGIMQTIADTLQLGLEWYSEGDSKKAALGKLSAEKSEMIHAMNRAYDIPWKKIRYQDEAIADAMAIYNVASKQSSALRLLK